MRTPATGEHCGRVQETRKSAQTPLMGYPLDSGMVLRRSLWGGPPGPRRTLSSAHEQAGQGPGCRRGRPPHRGSLVGGYLSQVDSPFQANEKHMRSPGRLARRCLRFQAQLGTSVTLRPCRLDSVDGMLRDPFSESRTHSPDIEDHRRPGRAGFLTAR